MPTDEGAGKKSARTAEGRRRRTRNVRVGQQPDGAASAASAVAPAAGGERLSDTLFPDLSAQGPSRHLKSVATSARGPTPKNSRGPNPETPRRKGQGNGTPFKNWSPKGRSDQDDPLCGPTPVRNGRDPQNGRSPAKNVRDSHGRGHVAGACDRPFVVEMSDVNKRVQTIRMELHAGKKDLSGSELAPPQQVRLTTVVERLCQSYDVSALKQLSARVDHDHNPHIRPLDINLVDQLRIIRLLEQKIDTWIRAYLFSRDICTLHSLNKQIAADFSEKDQTPLDGFCGLQMGPLVAHRMIKEKFKVHQGMRIPNLSESDIYDAFWAWKDKFAHKKTARRLHKCQFELRDFLVFLASEKAVETPEDLGLYIFAPDRFIGSFFKVCGAINSSQRAVKTAWQKKTEKQVQQSVIDKLEALVDSTEGPAAEGKHLTEDVLDFLVAWRQQRAEPFKSTAQALRWALTAAADASDSAKPGTKTKKKNRKAAEAPSTAQFIPKITIRAAASTLAAFLYSGGSMPPDIIDAAVADHSSLTQEQLVAEIKTAARHIESDREGLAWISDLEQHICKNLGIPMFEALGRGPFVHFLSQHEHSCVDDRFSTRGDPVRSHSGASQSNDSCNLKVNPEEVQAVLESAMTTTIDCHDGTLSFLRDLEDHVCQHFKVTAFGDLGCGMSFVAYLADSPSSKIHSVVNGRRAVVPKDVLHAASKLIRDGCTDKEVVEATLCEAFDVSDLAALGCGEVQEIVDCARSLDTSNDSTAVQTAVTNVSLICPIHTLRMPGKIKDIDFSSRTFAIECILRCPPIINIASHLQWRHLFAAHHGELATFINGIRPSEHRDSALFRYIHSCPGGPIAKVDARPENAKFSAALEDRDAHKAAAQLVALLVSAGSVACLSANVLQTYCARMTETALSDGDRQGPVFLFLQILREIPPWGNLRATLAPVILKPLRETMSSVGSKWPMEAELERLCGDDSELFKTVLQVGIGGGNESLLKPQLLIESFWARLNQSVAKSQSIEINLSSAANVPEGTAEVGASASTIDTSECIPYSPSSSNSDSPVHDHNDQIPAVVDVDVISDSGERESRERIVIDEIRKDFIGDLESKTMEHLRSALERISSDLYSEDSHFVLELIQNADDNSYDGATEPQLQFSISKHDIVVANNENGFDERNVRALCAVGKSTKGAGGVGFIGQKGIGFKSVFTVSDAPEIHSNGFHFALDKKYMIVPTWVDGYSDANCWTEIRLPLNDRTAMRLENLHGMFIDPDVMSPLLLLFLKKLRKITIIDQLDLDDSGPESKRCLQRVDIGRNIIQLHDNDETEKWMVVRRRLSHLDIRRSNTDTTDIAIAIPIDDTEYQTCDVFSFLPVDDYGFKFVVQADFILTSSREKVSEKAWNEQIRDHIHELFVDVLHLVRDHQHTVNFDGPVSHLSIVHVLRRIPVEKDLKSFFKPVATKIRDALQLEPCVPTTDGHWCSVSDVVRASNHLQTIVPPEMLFEHLKLRYVRGDVAKDVDKTILDYLGVRTLSSTQLLDLLAEILPGSSTNPMVNPEWAGKVLAYFHRENSLCGAELARVKKLALIPLTDGRWMSVCDGVIFRGTKNVVASGFEQEIATVHYDFFGTGNPAPINQALRILGVNVATAPDVVERHIIPALQAGEIETQPPQTVAAYLIFVKTHLSELSQSLQYKLTQSLAVPVCYVEESKKVDGLEYSWVSRGVRRVHVDCSDLTTRGIYFVGNSEEDAKILSDWTFYNRPAAHRAKWCAVDLKFLADQRNSLSPQEWVMFLTQLFPRQLKIAICRSKWLRVSRDHMPWVESDEEAFGYDYCSEDINQALLHLVGDPQQDQRKVLLGKSFDVSNEHFKRRVSAISMLRLQVESAAAIILPQLDAEFNHSRTPPAEGASLPHHQPSSSHAAPYEPQWKGPESASTKTPSSLARSLTFHAWLAPRMPNPERRLYAPCATFFDNPETREVGGGFINLLNNSRDSMLPTVRDMWKKLGVRDEIDGSTLLDLLRSWSSADTHEHRFRTSVKHFYRVLQHAQKCIYDAEQNNPQMAEKIRSAFAQEPLIWLPDVSVERRNIDGASREHEFQKVVDGKFWHVKDLTWNDPSKILDFIPGPPRVCGQHYTMKDAQNFFTRSMCFKCIQGGYGAQGVRNCPECEKAMKRYQNTQSERVKEVGGKISDWHFVCAGIGRSLIPYMATVEQYVKSLRSLTVHEPQEAEERVITLLKVLSIGVFLQEMPVDMMESLPELFRTLGKVFPAKCGKQWEWASLMDGLIINDNPECGQLFQNDNNLHFLTFGFTDPTLPLTKDELRDASDDEKIWKHRQAFDLCRCLKEFVPGYTGTGEGQGREQIAAHCVREANSLRPLLQRLGVSRLSACVSQTVRPFNGRAMAHPAYLTLSEACRVLQRWLNATHPKECAELDATPHFKTALASVKIITVDKIVIEHRLQMISPKIDTIREQHVPCHLKVSERGDPQTLYVAQDTLTKDGFQPNGEIEIWLTFLRLLPERIRARINFTSLVELLCTWEGTQQSKREGFLLRSEVPVLPDDRSVWEIACLDVQPPNFMSDPSELLADVHDDTLDSPITTFSGGFDKVPRRKTAPKAPEQAQFPAPQDLAVVVAEEDGRFRSAPGESAHLEPVASNLIYPQTETPILQPNGASKVAENSIERPEHARDCGVIVEGEISSVTVSLEPGSDEHKIQDSTDHTQIPSKLGHAVTRRSGLGSACTTGSATDSAAQGGVGERAFSGDHDTQSRDDVFQGFSGCDNGNLTLRLCDGDGLNGGTHLPIGALSVPEAAAVVGRLGEEKALRLLQSMADDKSLNQLKAFQSKTDAKWTIRWVNAIKETGSPFDLECVYPTGQKVYVEVKSTSSSDKVNFEISTAELMLARDSEPSDQEDPDAPHVRYVILRVYLGSGIVDLVDRPWMLLESKGAQLYMRL